MREVEHPARDEQRRAVRGDVAQPDRDEGPLLVGGEVERDLGEAEDLEPLVERRSLAQPPDPATVGPRWRDMWFARMERTPALVEPRAGLFPATGRSSWTRPQVLLRIRGRDFRTEPTAGSTSRSTLPQ